MHTLIFGHFCLDLSQVFVDFSRPGEQHLWLGSTSSQLFSSPGLCQRMLLPAKNDLDEQNWPASSSTRLAHSSSQHLKFPSSAALFAYVSAAGSSPGNSRSDPVVCFEIASSLITSTGRCSRPIHFSSVSSSLSSFPSLSAIFDGGHLASRASVMMASGFCSRAFAGNYSLSAIFLCECC